MTKEADDAARAVERFHKKMEEINNTLLTPDEIQENIIDRLNTSEELLKILNDARESKRRNGL